MYDADRTLLKITKALPVLNNITNVSNIHNSHNFGKFQSDANIQGGMKPSRVESDTHNPLANIISALNPSALRS